MPRMRADSLLTMGSVGVGRVPARTARISLLGGSSGERGLSSAISCGRACGQPELASEAVWSLLLP